jgi:hypothetical protein
MLIIIVTVAVSSVLLYKQVGVTDQGSGDLQCR